LQNFHSSSSLSSLLSLSLLEYRCPPYDSHRVLRSGHTLYRREYLTNPSPFSQRKLQQWPFFDKSIRNLFSISLSLPRSFVSLATQCSSSEQSFPRIRCVCACRLVVFFVVHASGGGGEAIPYHAAPSHLAQTKNCMCTMRRGLCLFVLHTCVRSRSIMYVMESICL